MNKNFGVFLVILIVVGASIIGYAMIYTSSSGSQTCWDTMNAHLNRYDKTGGAFADNPELVNYVVRNTTMPSGTYDTAHKFAAQMISLEILTECMRDENKT